MLIVILSYDTCTFLHDWLSYFTESMNVNTDGMTGPLHPALKLSK